MKKPGDSETARDTANGGEAMFPRQREAKMPFEKKGLPPILEKSKSSLSLKSAKSSRSKTPGQTSTSPKPEARSPLPRRRASVACFSSEEARRIALRHNSTFRRNSFTVREMQIDVDAEEELIPAIMARRTSFHTIGNRVSTLLRAKNAFQRFRKKPAIEDDAVADESAFEIKEMPRHPRFASTLSAEAQYAIMKGYEDVVYGYLTTSFPEYRSLLRRSRTPMSGVEVSTEPYDVMRQKEKSILKDATDGNTHNSSSDSIRTPNEAHEQPSVDENANTAEKDGDRRTDDDDDTHQEIATVSKANQASEGRASPSQRPRLPYLVPKEKQLVLTYRYQSAMDLLDDVRKQLGVHPLSPRARGQTHAKPVKEFNSWSFVWNYEFQPKTNVSGH